MRSQPRFAVTLLLGVLMAGCSAGSQPGADGTTAAPVTTAPSPSGGTMSPSLSPPGRPPADPGKSSGEVVLTGQVELVEIEGGCLVLRVGAQGYQLIGVDQRSARPGTAVTVRGRIRTDVVTTCQVGPVLEVVEIRPA